MHASLKSVMNWRPSRQAAQRLTLLLGLGTALGCLLAYSLSSPVPLALLVLSLAAAIGVLRQYLRLRSAIKFQPQELADRLLQVRKANVIDSAGNCTTTSANCSPPQNCKTNG